MDAQPDFQLQELQQTIQQIRQQLHMLRQQKQELEQVSEAIAEMKKTKNGHELLIPLGAGVFTKAKVSENKTIILNVGAQIAVEKDISSAEDLIGKQLQELTAIEASMNEELAHVSQQFQFLQMSQAANSPEKE
ncbi:prefoldin subunit alpha [Candidatus Woesearchaeota archaeon]|nr:prefoldin subunit alpha [Candidatus Woesearchaeota archaeon]